MKIFVSYSRSDAGDFAEQIQKVLTDHGHDVFTDVKNIQLGTIWSHIIQTNISNCDIFVIVITHTALRSPHVESEVLQAQRENKTIIPCIYRYVKYNEIKWNLDSLQGIEFNNQYELARSLGDKIVHSYEGRESFPKEASGVKENSNKHKEVQQSKVETPSQYTSTSTSTYKKDSSAEKSKKVQGFNLKIIIPIIAVVAAIGGIVAFTFLPQPTPPQPIPETTTPPQPIPETTTPPQPTPEAPDTLLSKGIALNDLGKYDEAITYFDEALAINPSYKNALLSKGWSLNNLGRYEEAIEYYDRAIEIDPNYLLAYNNKGLALDTLGRYDEAITNYNKALAINPSYDWALINKGNALLGLGRYDEAITYFDKALAIDPNDEEALSSKNDALKMLGNGT